MSYRPHEHLVDPARAGRSGIGWLVLGIAVVLMLTYTGSLFYYGMMQGMLNLPVDELLDGTTPKSLMVLLFSFGMWILAVVSVVPMVHNRSFRSVLGDKCWTDFASVLFMLALLYVVLIILPPWTLFSDTIPALPFGRWLMLLPLTLLGLLIQVSAEEILFRGYLQQQLAARFRSPVIWMGVPSVLFGLAHYDPSLGSNTWLFVCWAVVFGLLAADLTARSGSLGPAIALHLINNIFALVLISPPDSLSGLSLFHYSFPLSDEAAVRAILPVDFALMFVSWLAARLALRA